MVVSLIICLLFLVYARSQKLNILDPICVFFMMWAFITGMYCLIPGDILPPSLYTSFIYAIGLASFGAGAVASRNLSIKKPAGTLTILPGNLSQIHPVITSVSWFPCYHGNHRLNVLPPHNQALLPSSQFSTAVHPLCPPLYAHTAVCAYAHV